MTWHRCVTQLKTWHMTQCDTWYRVVHYLFLYLLQFQLHSQTELPIMKDLGLATAPGLHTLSSIYYLQVSVTFFQQLSFTASIKPFTQYSHFTHLCRPVQRTLENTFLETNWDSREQIKYMWEYFHVLVIFRTTAAAKWFLKVVELLTIGNISIFFVIIFVSCLSVLF